MSLKAMYNKIADQYETADRFGSISTSHNIALQQLKSELLDFNLTHQRHIVDLGVGNGSFLNKTQTLFPHAKFTGIDISHKMLEYAREKLPLNTIEASAAEAANYLPPHSQDLIIAHFINAYVPLDILLQEASTLMKANGYFSFITTTYESFPLAQQHLASFIAESSLLSSVIGHYYKAMVKNTTVANNQEELFASFEKHQLQIVASERIQIPITLETIDDLATFGIEGTWFLNSIATKMLPQNFVVSRMKRLFSKIFTFPYEDTHVIDIILAKR